MAKRTEATEQKAKMGGQTEKKKEEHEKKTGQRAGTPAARGEEIVEFEAAQALLKTTRSTLYRWIRQGRLRAMKAGRQWRFRREDLRRFLEGESAELALPVSVQPFLDALREQIAQAPASAKQSPEAPAPAPETSLLRQAADLVLHLAVRVNASDIHITPNRGLDGQLQVPVRMRVDGLLRTMATLDPRLLVHFVKEWKGLAGCSVQETARPQDGRATLDMAGTSYDCHFCFLPSSQGESVVVRPMKFDEERLSLEQCGFLPDQRMRVEEAAHASHGLVLFTGRTGSGKGLSMFSALGTIQDETSSVLSIEQPPYSFLPWVTQIAVGDQSGLPVHAILRFVRQADPDVIAFGEIRDFETLHLATEFVETGHLILATLIAPDATQAFVRMLEMGESPLVLGSTVRLVVSQWLKRHVCPDCGQPAKPDANLRKRFERTLVAGGVDPASLAPHFREGAGCAKCHGTGFHTRSAYAELLRMTPGFAEALRAPHLQHAALRAVAIAEGMAPMEVALVRHAYEGTTSIREAERLLGQP